MAGIIDGKQLAETIRKEIASDVQEFFNTSGRRPRLAAVLAGDDPASHVYVRNKVKACEQVGIDSESHLLDSCEPKKSFLDCFINSMSRILSMEFCSNCLCQKGSARLKPLMQFILRKM